MTQLHRDSLAMLALGHPVPSEEKMTRKLHQLERISGFYQMKLPEAAPKQALMFSGFISSVLYAMEIIKRYRHLAEQIAELSAKENKK